MKASEESNLPLETIVFVWDVFIGVEGRPNVQTAVVTNAEVVVVALASKCKSLPAVSLWSWGATWFWQL